MLERLKFWRSKSPSAFVFEADKLSEEDRQKLMQAIAAGGSVVLPKQEQEAIGDGQAVFLGEGTHEEFVDQERADKGEKHWYDRILGRED